MDASIALETILKACPSLEREKVIEALNNFPGTGRRFEKIADGVYSDYGHHPVEIKATLEMAKELKERDGYKGVVAVYQPHQNVRQYEVRNEYKDAFTSADKLFWLPTYLVREDPNLAILSPEDLIAGLSNPEIAEVANSDEVLAEKLRQLHEEGWLVILLTAGPADSWFRGVFA
jgi:UDP-N-acetylmuramate--alanine ligase